MDRDTASAYYHDLAAEMKAVGGDPPLRRLLSDLLFDSLKLHGLGITVNGGMLRVAAQPGLDIDPIVETAIRSFAPDLAELAAGGVPPQLFVHGEAAEPGWIQTFGRLRARFEGPTEWLVPGYVLRRALTLVPGPPESFKSFGLVADLARAVYTGDFWLDYFQVPHGPVIIIEAERMRNLTYQLGLLEKGHSVDLSGILVGPPQSGLNLLSTEFRQHLISLVHATRPALVAMNSYGALYPGAPADRSQMHSALGWLGRLAEQTDCSIVVIDQLNRAGIHGRVRGAEAQADSGQKQFEADGVLHIERDCDPVGRGIGPARIYVGKLREGEAGPPFVFHIEPSGDGVRFVYDGTVDAERPLARPPTNEERVLAYLEENGASKAKAIAEALNLSQSSVSNSLTVLKKQGSVTNPEYGSWDVQTE